jgi:hypothetical protein
VSLGKTANNTVINFTMASSAQTSNDDEDTSSKDEDIDHEFNNEVNEQSTNDERAIGGLISRIASWQHVQPPNH